MPTSTVRISMDCVTIRGQRNDFHASTKEKRASVAMAGRASGRAMRQKMVHSEAPSMRAASSVSRGRVEKNCRMRKMPQTETTSVDTSPAIVSTPPSASISKKRGMSRTMPGIMSAPR